MKRTIFIIALFATMLSLKAFAFEILTKCNSSLVCSDEYWDYQDGENPMALWVNPELISSDVIKMAANEWNVAGAANFNFIVAGDTAEKEIVYDGMNLVTGRTGAVVIPLAPGVYISGCDGSLAFSAEVSVESSGEDAGEIVEKDIIFCMSGTEHALYVGTSTPPADEYDLMQVATHELGHDLGLDDVEDDAFKSSTMYYHVEPGDISKRSLAPDDIAGIQAIYGEHDNDVDKDGVPNISDNCPFFANPDQADSDNDSVGNVCDINVQNIINHLPQIYNRFNAMGFKPEQFESHCGNGPSALCVQLLTQ